MGVSRPFVLFAVWFGISFLTRSIFIPVEILDMDEAAHAVGSWVWMDGGSLYRDFINNKPPLLYVYYAAAQLLFGRGIVSVHLLTSLFVIPLTALAVSAFYDYDKRGQFAGLLFLIYSAAFLAHDMHSTNAEVLMILPGAWAIVILRKKEMCTNSIRMILAGSLFGIGFLFKYQIALGILAISFVNLKMNRNNLRFLLLIPGFLIPIAITILLFYKTDGLDSLFYWLLWNNLRYSANPISMFEAAGRAASYLLPFLLVTAPLWWLTFRSRRILDDYKRLLTAALLIVSIPPIFVGFRFYPHYFIQLYFPLAIAAAPALFDLVEKKKARWLFTYSVLLLITTTAVNAYLYYGNNNVYRERDNIYATVAERLKRDSCVKDGTLFVWGYAPAFYYYAGLQAELKPASRFVVMGQARLTGYVSGNLGSLNQPSQAGVSQHWEWLMSDLERNDTTFILDTAPAAIYRWDHYPLSNFPRLKNYVDEKFEQIDIVEGVTIYRKRNCK